MRFLRHAAVQRLFSAGLLLSLTVWLAAPVLGATAPRAFEADWLGAEVPPTVEAAFEQALTEAASRGARTPEAFVAAFADVLAAQADPELAQFLEGHAPDALLTVLYGQWMRAFSHHRGLEAAPSSPAAPPAGTALGSLGYQDRPEEAPRAWTVVPLPAQADQAFRPLAVLSSAQPLGP